VNDVVVPCRRPCIAVLFRHDPIDIDFNTNTNGHRPESETIVAQLNT
jgi:hypothetical protein